jgi:hypothetical protein
METEGASEFLPKKTEAIAFVTNNFCAFTWSPFKAGREFLFFGPSARKKGKKRRGKNLNEESEYDSEVSECERQMLDV